MTGIKLEIETWQPKCKFDIGDIVMSKTGQRFYKVFYIMYDEIRRSYEIVLEDVRGSHTCNESDIIKFDFHDKRMMVL